MNDNFYQILIEHSPAGYAYLKIIYDETDIPCDYIIIEINSAFENMTKLNRFEIINRKITDIVSDNRKDMFNWIEYFKNISICDEEKVYELYSENSGNCYRMNVCKTDKNYLTTYFVDITEENKLLSELKTSNIFKHEYLFNQKEQLKATLLSISEGVISTDKQGIILTINKTAESLTGWTQTEAIDKPLEEVFKIINEFDGENCKNPVYNVLENGDIIKHTDHTVLISRDGIEKFIEDSIAPIKDENGNVIGAVITFRDYNENKLKQNEIDYLYFNDQLTGLYNRKFYESALKRLDTEKSMPLTIVLGYINGVKLIKDSFGYKMSDELLKKAAEIIKKGCRETDIIARIDDDEFVILLPKTDALEAMQTIKHIKNLLSAEKLNGMDISVSFGGETKQNIENNIQKIFIKAETHMYNNRLFESSNIHKKIIETIIKTLYEKNNTEREHSHRVSRLCKNIGEALELSDYKINELKTVGLLHDIGKIAIDQNLINKSDELTDDEWTEIMCHPEKGYRILSSVNEMTEMAEYVLAHHERWDGQGYPKSLKGEEIPLESRIITIADAYDAMTGGRSYRSTLSVKSALTELRDNSGTQFDPELVNLFIDKLLWEEFNY